MSEEMHESAPMAHLVSNSLLYRQSKAREQEILKHKWFESEKAGHDIGYEKAEADWTVKHYSLWRKAWLEQVQRGF